MTRWFLNPQNHRWTPCWGEGLSTLINNFYKEIQLEDSSLWSYLHFRINHQYKLSKQLFCQEIPIYTLIQNYSWTLSTLHKLSFNPPNTNIWANSFLPRDIKQPLRMAIEIVKQWERPTFDFEGNIVHWDKRHWRVWYHFVYFNLNSWLK